MKRQLLPLLGIAFVVALISTGIFYGVIVARLRNSNSKPARSIVVAARQLDRGVVLKPADVKLLAWEGVETPKGFFTAAEKVVGLTVVEPIHESEPVTEWRAASKQTKGEGALAIPAGMRAVSVRVTEPSGVASMLHSGHRVDVQVVRTLPNGETHLRTVQQNVEVLSLAQPEGRSSGPPVVTLLATPSEAETLGLADTGARIRLVLRNPLDGDPAPLAGASVAKLFQRPEATRTAPRTTGRQRTELASAAASSETAGRQILLRVRIAGAGPAALEEMNTRLVVPRRADLIQASAFRAGWDLEKALPGLEASQGIEILSASHLVTRPNRGVSFQAGAQWNEPWRGYGIRIQFLPSAGLEGKLRLRVEPEVTAPQSDGGVATRKIETDIELLDGQSFLVTGLLDSGEKAAGMMARLFPGQASGSNRELVVLGTLQFVRPAPAGRQTAALVKDR